MNAGSFISILLLRLCQTIATQNYTFDHTNKFNTAAEDVERPVTPPNAEADAFKSESSAIHPRERNVRGTMYCTRGVNWDGGMIAYQHDEIYDRMEKVHIMRRADGNNYEVHDDPLSESYDWIYINHDDLLMNKDERDMEILQSNNEHLNFRLFTTTHWKPEKFTKTTENLILCSDTPTDIREIYEHLLWAIKSSHTHNADVLPEWERIQAGVSIKELIKPKQ